MTGSGALHPVVRLAPAKLNLTLAVLGTRPDGFHDLHSVMVPLGLADRLSLARAAGAADSLHVVGVGDGRTPLDPAGFGSVLSGIVEARRVVGRGADTFALAVRLEKRIPVAAGLAGGSSDAAAAIEGALEAWGARSHRRSGSGRQRRQARTCPFFLAGGPALVEGRGERVTPLAGFAGDPPGVLLVTPAVEASTRAAFARFDAHPAAVPANRGSTRLTLRAPRGGDGPGARADARRRAREPRRRARGGERPGERGGPPRARTARAASRPDAPPRVSRSGCPARARPSGRSILRSAARRRPPVACARRSRLGPARQPRIGRAIRRSHDHRQPTTEGNHDPSSRQQHRRAPAPSGRTARPSPPTTSCSAPARSASTRPAASSSRAASRPRPSGPCAISGAVLDAAGCTFADVVKTTCFLVDINDFAAFNAVYARFMPDPPPARSTFAVAALPKAASVEIEAIAIRRS